MSFLQKIIDFLRNLFGLVGDVSDKLPSDKGSNSPSPFPEKVDTTSRNPQIPTTDAPTESTNFPQPLPSSNQATFKYGGRTINLSKSKQYVAVKKHENVNIPAVFKNTTSRSVSPLEDETQKLGHFDLITSKYLNLDTIEVALDDLRSLDAVEVGTHVFHHSETDETPLIPSGELYVVFQTNANLSACHNLLKQYYLTIVEERSDREFIVAVTSKSPNPIKTTIALQQESHLIEIAEPDLESPTGLTALPLPADHLLPAQWHLQNRGQHAHWTSMAFRAGADAKVVEAWQAMNSLGSSNITVAIIDSGFDLQHPDLVGNGHKVVAPWDFETNTPDPSPRLGDWHGTACAGVAIGAITGSGIVGAAPNAKFIPIRFTYISDSQVEKWFSHAIRNGADVISNSWGSQSDHFILSTRMFNALKRAATQGRNGKGAVLVFASGNTSRNISNGPTPQSVTGFATHPNVIAVAASNSKDQRSSYSNYGHHIHITAPSNGSGGAGVTTADVGGTMLLPSGAVGHRGYGEGIYTHGFGGTSSSCPLVAGVCALILSANPSLSARQVKDILRDTADKIGGVPYDRNGHSVYFGYGRINAAKAVRAARNGNVTIPEITPPPVSPPPPPPNPNPVSPPVSPPISDVEVKPLTFEVLRGGAIVGAGTEHLYKISISNRLTVKLDSPIGESGSDFDLYVKRNSIPVPETRSYDYSSTKQGTNESINIANPALADYYIFIRSYKGGGGYNLVASLEPSSGRIGNTESLTLQAMVGGILMTSGNKEAAYKVGTRNKLTVKIDSPVGNNNNFDIYVKRGGIPRWNDYDGRGITPNSSEIVVLQPKSGDYYIMVRSQKGSGGYNLKITLT